MSMEKLPAFFRHLFPGGCIFFLAGSGFAEEFSFSFNEKSLAAGKWGVNNHDFSFNPDGLPVFRIPLPPGKNNERPEVVLSVKEVRQLPTLTYEKASGEFVTEVYSTTA